MRAKIILPNLLAVLVLGLGGYLFLQKDLSTAAVNRLSDRIKTSRLLYDRSEKLSTLELRDNVNSHAMSKHVLEAFAPVDTKQLEGESEEDRDKRIRGAWFQKCVRAIEGYTEHWSGKKDKRPEIVFLTDRKGVVIARNTTPNACPKGYNVSKIMPVVTRAMAGLADSRIWSIDDSPFNPKKKNSEFCELMNTGLLEVAAAPIRDDEQSIVGVLVIGFEISNGTAKKKAEMLGLDLAILNGGKVYSSSFETDTARQSVQSELDKPEIAGKIDEAVDKGVPSDTFMLTIEGKPYLALVTPANSADKKDRVATLIIGSLDEASADVGSLVVLLVLMGVVLLMVIIVGAVLTNHFLKPIVAIEEGLLKVINGEYNYRFDVKSSEVGGLSYRINQLIGVLTGEEEESEE